MAILIAEVGNNHFGSMKIFTDMIRIAKECGADAVKGQALRDKPWGGSMPREFYTMCALEDSEYLDAIEYGRSIGIEVFYSIFDWRLDWLTLHQHTHKMSASQMMAVEDYRTIDVENMVVSVNDKFIESYRLERFRPKYASVMYACDYLDNNYTLHSLWQLNDQLKRNAGYSDHSQGINKCLLAVREYQAPIIEKHFTLERNFKYKDQIFRDTVHGASPDELEKLAKGIK